MSVVTPPSLPEKEEDLRLRLTRFEKTVTLCLCIVPFVFSAQCLFASLSAPVFTAMFKDFGAKLPAPTQMVLNTWPFWSLLALAAPVSAVIVARRARATFSVVYSTVVGIGMFLVAQCITASLFLPIFQLGAVAGGMK